MGGLYLGGKKIQSTVGKLSQAFPCAYPNLEIENGFLAKVFSAKLKE